MITRGSARNPLFAGGTCGPHVTRRSLLGAAVAGAAAVASPMLAMAEPAGSKTAGSAGVASEKAQSNGSLVHALNQVDYPDPIPSDNYDALNEALEANSLDKAFLEALSAFANDLACYGIGQQEADDEHPNICLSPASLYLALALLAQGAGLASQTSEQLLGTLRADDASSLAEGCAKLMRALWARTTPEGDERPCTMQVANSVWTRSDIPFEKVFLDRAAESFYAECFGVDVAEGPAAKEGLSAAADSMGEWVAEHTGGALKPGFVLDDDWIAGLINTVWFKDAWFDEFNPNDTFQDVFHAAAGDVSCDFMTLSKNCDVVRSGGVTAASLGLMSGASLTFVLPDEEGDPRMLLGRAAGIGKLYAMEGASTAHVTFVVPKLSFDTKVDLARVCDAMGVVDVFGDDADLSALTSAKARVSSVEQGTHFSMDEQGVEASAYTAIMISTMSLELDEPEKVELRLDRPFLFRLTSPEGVVLFDGLVGNPTKG